MNTDLAATIERFFTFLAAPARDEPVDRRELIAQLDALAMMRHGCADVWPDDSPDPPDTDYQATYAVLGARFPAYGYYTAVDPLTEPGTTPKATLSDVIDDLADIVIELRRTQWRLQHNGPADGAASFAWSFDCHWGEHLRGLQHYLHNLRRRA